MNITTNASPRRFSSRLAAAACLSLLAVAALPSRATAADCMAVAAGLPGLNCTANDFGLSGITVTDILDDGCQGFGDTLNINALFGVAGGAPDRYDVGFYVAGDGQQAYTGNQCTVAVIPDGPDYANFDDDMCGDYDGSAILVPISDMTIQCVDGDGDGFFDVTVCTSWDNNPPPGCNGPEDAVPSTKAKCVCSIVNTDIETPHCASNSDCETDNNACTNEVCNTRESGLGDPFGCSHNPNTNPCDDGNFCTDGDRCTNGSCTGPARNCSDSLVCTTDVCDEANNECDHNNNTASCNDGNFCTTNDTCSGGICGGSARNCADSTVCTTDTCDETNDECDHEPNTLPCNDDLFCNGGDTCSAGVCVHTGNPCPGSDGDGDCSESCSEAGDNCESNDPNGTTCNDGLFCTENDVCTGGVCDGADRNCADVNGCTDDTCNETSDQCDNLPNTDPCDDGQFCNGADVCAAGSCGHAGDPCDGPDGDDDCSEVCDEELDNCSTNDPNGSGCDDGEFCTIGDICTDGVCDGEVEDCDDTNSCTDDSCDEENDECDNDPNTDPCDDELFCTGEDVCADGSCGHSGNPCDGSDGDDDCSETCDEEANDCNGNDQDGTNCDDGLFCNGGPDQCLEGECSQHPGFPCNDNLFCTNDDCNEDIDMCANTPVADGTECNDEDICTIDDDCQNGICVGEDTALLDLCPWIAVERVGAKKDWLKVNTHAGVGGDICGGFVKVGEDTIVDGDVASGNSSSPKAIRLTPAAFITEDIVSDGAGVKAKPGEAKLPHLAVPVSSLPPGSITPKIDPAGVFHLTGTHPLADDCVAARNVYPDVMAILDAFPAQQTLGKVKVKSFQTFAFSANVPGGVNVLDITNFKAGRNVTIQLDGAGNANTVVMLRVLKKFTIKLRSTIELTGNLQPENVLIYVKGKKCTFGDLMNAKGTVFCANGRLKLGRTVTWEGTFYGAGRILKIGDTNSLTYLPFQGF